MGLGTGLSSGVAVGVGDFFLCFRFVSGVGLGDGVGEVFLCFGEAVGEGLAVSFFVERFRCLRGAGVGVAKIFLIFLPNDSSTALTAWAVLNNSAMIKSHFIDVAYHLTAVGPAVPSGNSTQLSFRAKSRNL